MRTILFSLTTIVSSSAVIKVAAALAVISPSDPPVHTLLLCRHGDSIWNGGQTGYVEKFTGWTDVPLTQRGKDEALQAAKQLASFSYDIDACFTSILNRAHASALPCLQILSNRKKQPRTFVDYRLNERHYGALQSLVKKEVEDGKYGHPEELVQAWRRSWHVPPPPLDDNDKRRIKEIEMYSELCGGPHLVPRAESLEMVAKNRVRPFLDEVLTPVLDEAAQMKRSRMDKDQATTGLVVAHANSLRALIGVICEVEEDAAALRVLEALKIPTGVPLVMNYQRMPDGKYQVCPLPEAEECVINFDDGMMGQPPEPPQHLGHPSLPVWPLDSCIPVHDIFTGVAYEEELVPMGYSSRLVGYY